VWEDYTVAEAVEEKLGIPVKVSMKEFNMMGGGNKLLNSKRTIGELGIQKNEFIYLRSKGIGGSRSDRE